MGEDQDGGGRVNGIRTQGLVTNFGFLQWSCPYCKKFHGAGNCYYFTYKHVPGQPARPRSGILRTEARPRTPDTLACWCPACGGKWREMAASELPTLVDRESIPDEMAEKVEDEIGMGSGAWDMVDPKAIIAAVIKIWHEMGHG